MKLRATRQEITHNCFKHHGSEEAAITEGLTRAQKVLRDAIKGYRDKGKKFVIEVYIEDDEQ